MIYLNLRQEIMSSVFIFSFPAAAPASAPAIIPCTPPPARIRIDKPKSIIHRKNISIGKCIKMIALAAPGVGNIKKIVLPQYADVLE